MPHESRTISDELDLPKALWSGLDGVQPNSNARLRDRRSLVRIQSGACENFAWILGLRRLPRTNFRGRIGVVGYGEAENGSVRPVLTPSRSTRRDQPHG